MSRDEAERRQTVISWFSDRTELPWSEPLDRETARRVIEAVQMERSGLARHWSITSRSRPERTEEKP